MKNVKNNHLEVIRKIFEGDISFDDKRFVNPKCDKLWSKVNDMREKSNNEDVVEIFNKYNELINLLEIERFAQGAKFMYELMDELLVVEN